MTGEKKKGGRPKKERPEDPILACAREAKLLSSQKTLPAFRKNGDGESDGDSVFGSAILAHQRRVIRQAVLELNEIDAALRHLNGQKSAIYKRLRDAALVPQVIKKIVADRRVVPSLREERRDLFKFYWRAVTAALNEAETSDQAEEREAAE